MWKSHNVAQQQTFQLAAIQAELEDVKGKGLHDLLQEQQRAQLEHENLREKHAKEVQELQRSLDNARQQLETHQQVPAREDGCRDIVQTMVEMQIACCMIALDSMHTTAALYHSHPYLACQLTRGVLLSLELHDVDGMYTSITQRLRISLEHMYSDLSFLA